jgi:GDSL-like Lipase/Acylhydrolase family
MALNHKPVAFSIVLGLWVVGVLEITLHLLAFVSPRVDQLLGVFPPPPYTVPDERLDFRPNPAVPGHDRRGFRNPNVPATAPIVALGDSQTYGTHVRSQDAWPRQLTAMTGETVYSMAYGGYGPAHRLLLWDEAVEFEPELVIEAFYAGNDLFDAFDLVYNRGQLPALKGSDPQWQERIRQAEELEPIAQRVAQIDQHTFRVLGGTTEEASDALLPSFPAQYSRIYGLLRRTTDEVMRVVKKAPRRPQSITLEKNWETLTTFVAVRPAYCQVFDNGRLKTVFTSAYRLVALSLDDPRIAEGLQISLRAMQAMQEKALARKIRLLVLLIPTKETVFRQLEQNPPESYRRLTEYEEYVWRAIKDFLERHSIDYLDALPALQAQLTAGMQPYPVSNDGHPNKHGHRAIAQLVNAYLGRGH